MDERDCAEAVAEIYGFLDRELDDAVMIQIEAHLRRCAPCLDAFDFEVELRRVIAARCTEQVTPQVRERFCQMLRDLGSGSVGVPPVPEPS
ncbi:MAG: mycothiol system anti-sigma-R factor [Actinobacteria bacterium]|nr:mycothiol system anti-sigma-R factor [Actinomycetota bacterium]